ncbi:hypothetical protein TPHA_0C00750 [Tetrapisispora phaffii CBS 4417]|uniref:RWD domain-containing protein n=1 Tax=Tetrapisispora phaffii (strain ATCC 24235 / CBS 4417 / NBRC 1672 / NRRL Y-8282 / UCD 70-5) TaxID=1071381 RepID=G8BR55_TETPH|nr:hypothetical protein TPHA_0C00750 [Tetrapisispora phaffii CBS 4417]CCE62231.1 hypothetical protein TPHA_0C00750 [Tetrapisispora phaffii CBS 4417]
MDYKEEQQQEIEVLESIYPDELTIINDNYPNIQFEVTLKLDVEIGLGSLSKEHIITVHFQLPENYPDEPPIIRLKAQEISLKDDEEEEEEEEEREFDEHGNIIVSKLENLPDKISFQKYMPVLESQIESQIESDMLIGMQMCFTLLSTTKDSCETWFRDELKTLEQEYEKKREEKEKEEQVKFNGTKVTKESYLAWREKFRNELKMDRKDHERREEAHNGKLTGKMMFERNVAGTNDDIDEAEGEVENNDNEVNDIASSLKKI